MAFADFLNTHQYKAQIRRLEAFLSALPGVHLAWMPDGTTILHRDLGSVLGVGDPAPVLTPETLPSHLPDAFRGPLSRHIEVLRHQHDPFDMIARTHTERYIRIRGQISPGVSARDHLAIIHIDDVTALETARRAAEMERDHIRLHRDRAIRTLKAIPRPIWQRNEHGQVNWCNDTYASILNVPIEQVVEEKLELGFSIPGRKNMGDAADAGALYRKVQDTHTAQNELRQLIIKGARHFMQVYEFPVSNYGETIGIALDVTREEELHALRRRDQSAMKELLSQLSTAIALFDAEQKLEFYNASYGRLWTLDEGWLNQRPRLGDILEKLRETRLLPEQADFRKYKQHWLDHFTRLIGPHDELLHLPDGRTIRMIILPHPMGGLMMTFEDVTSRLELESSYNTLMAVQRETLDSLLEGVAVFGSDGRLRLFNPSFATLWSLHPEDIDGDPHISRLVERMKQRFEPALWEESRALLMTHALSRQEKQERLTLKDKSVIDLTSVGLPDGGVMMTCADVTDSVSVESALRERNAALETAEQIKTDFLANVSYQLRTPLNTVMGFTEIIGNEYFGSLNDRQKEYTRGIFEASQRLEHLIDDILDVTTIDAGFAALTLTSVDPIALINGLQDMVQDWARRESIHFYVDCPPGLPPVTGDEARLKQALVNLVRNAIAFTPAGGRIDIKARTDKGFLMIDVIDSGFGIPPEDQKRIFEPFERANSVRRQDGKIVRGGAGLGLTLVKRITELHHGTVELDSALGQGTRVTLRLPITACPSLP